MSVPYIRQQGKTIPFAAGSRASIELQRGMVLRELYIRLTGQLTLAAASNTQTLTSVGDEWAVIKDLIIRLDGRDILKRIDGPRLRWLNYMLYGSWPMKFTGTIGDGATLNTTFNSTLIIPFWMPKSVRPMDFALDTRLLSRLDLEVQWGTFTDINSAATGFTVNPQIDIFSNEITNVQGNFARWNVFPIANTFAGAANNQQFKLPVGYLYRGFLINQSAINLINQIRFKAGALTWFDLPYNVLEPVIGNDRRGPSPEPLSTPGGGLPLASQLFFNATNNAADYRNANAYIDMVSDGFNSEAIDTFGMTEAFIEMDIAAAGTVTIFPMQLVVPRS